MVISILLPSKSKILATSNLFVAVGPSITTDKFQPPSQVQIFAACFSSNHTSTSRNYGKHSTVYWQCIKKKCAHTNQHQLELRANPIDIGGMRSESSGKIINNPAKTDVGDLFLAQIQNTPLTKFDNTHIDLPRLNQIDSLFGSSIGGWLPDETLFSLCSRWHRIGANGLASSTCAELFGHTRIGVAHDLPARISTFVTRTNGILGDARSIAVGRTLLRYYLPFQPENVVKAAVDSVCGPKLGSLKMLLGLPASRLRAHHPLKSCPICRQEDAKTNGVAHWHLNHQLPGVWICHRHGQVLEVAAPKMNGLGRFHWVLPDDCECRHIRLVDRRTLGDASWDMLVRMSAYGQAASQMSASYLVDRDRMLATFQKELVRKGYATPKGKWRSETIGAGLKAHLSLVASVPDLGALKLDSAQAVNLFRKVLAHEGAVRHPAKVLAVIAWLFRDWEQFAAYFDETAAPNQTWQRTAAERSASAGHGAERPAESTRADFISLVVAGAAVTSAARTVGIDPHTGMAWACKLGICPASRPKKLVDSSKKAMVKALRFGISKPRVASRFDISIGTVTRVLRTTPGLQREWHDAREARALDLARSQWTRCVQRCGHLGVKQVRHHASAAYAYLYRNDKAWLEEVNARLPRIASGKRHHIDWKLRDETYCRAINSIFAAELAASPSVKLAMHVVLEAVPELGPKLAQLHRLPATRELLRELTVKHKVILTKRKA